MKYKLINRTKISSEVLKTLIEFAAPKGIKKVTISVMYDNPKGLSAWRGVSYTLKKNKSIIIRFQKSGLVYPVFSNRKEEGEYGYTPRFLIRDLDEALLSLFAHELRHIWQMNVSKRRFWTGKMYNFVDWDGRKLTSIYKMESDACGYAKRTLDRYRKL